MIIEKLKNEKQLTESEKLIARYLLDKNNNVADLTSTELGHNSYSSQSAVIRLYKKFGIKTYREFMRILAVERSEYFKIRDFEDKNPCEFFSSYEDTKSTVLKMYESIFMNTNLLLDRNTIIRVCNRLLNASSIDIYGGGISGTIARQMVFKLQSLGMNASFFDGMNQSYIQSMKESQNNVSVLISLSGNNDIIYHVAKLLKEKNIYTVVFTRNNEDRLVNMCRDLLLLDTIYYDHFDVMGTSIAAEYIINFIYSLMISRCQI